MDWTKEELGIFRSLSDSNKIQEFLDSVDYNPSYECRSPRHVMKRRKAHCFEGAIFAAAALRFNGYRPLLIDMKSFNDDDHVLAVFKEDGYWGSIGKSNFTTLRYREPVYRSIRELVMSYFDFYFNTKGEKTLRSYSLPLDLSAFDHRKWETTDEDLEYLGDKLEALHHFTIMSDKMISKLYPVSDSMMKAGLMGSDPEGLFKPS
jgi:hypothetical protein